MKVFVETLGCKVNTYEGEVIKSLFINNGDTLVSINDNPDVIVLNTCTVTNQSDAKSRKLIRQARRLNEEAILIVCGCSTQLHQKDMEHLRIDILLGNKDKSKILIYLNEYLKEKNNIVKFYDLNKESFEDMSIEDFSGRTRAFVKIQDGCNNYCSYCIIPYVRGNIRHKELNKAILEITKLVDNGYKEVVLTGIHTGSYGKGTNYNLVTLIKEISKLENLERIRISSIEITEIDDEFLSELKDNNKICDHLHIPIQNGSDYILKKMNRKYNLDYYKDKINMIRSIRPNINITTDLIVGFPLEEDIHFEETINTVKEIEFGKIHVFPFSKRDGTVAATMKNIVTDSVKKDRAKNLIILSEELENNYYKKFIDKEVEVLIEDYKDNHSIGHTSNYIKVLINKKLTKNEIHKVVIKEVNQTEVLSK